jgi:hypothetical protein
MIETLFLVRQSINCHQSIIIINHMQQDWQSLDVDQNLTVLISGAQFKDRGPMSAKLLLASLCFMASPQRAREKKERAVECTFIRAANRQVTFDSYCDADPILHFLRNKIWLQSHVTD